MTHYILILGIIVHLSGTATYLIKTLRGEVQPNRVSYLMWGAAPLITFAAQIYQGVTLAAVPVFMAGFGPMLIFFASYKNPKAYWKLERFDYLCGLLSVMALVLWGITKEPNIAILLAIISDTLAAVPTIVKSYRYPKSESVVNYGTSLFSSLTSFTVMKTWDFAELAFPIYLISCNTLIISVMLLGRFRDLRRVSSNV